MILVIDASVAAKWFVAEPLADAAAALFGAGASLLAPDLILPEVCNVAWRKLRLGEVTTEQATAIVNNLPDLLDALVPSQLLAARAIALAGELDHPAYDCFYLALAERHEARVVTADRRFHARTVASQYAALIVSLGAALS